MAKLSQPGNQEKRKSLQPDDDTVMKLSLIESLPPLTTMTGQKQFYVHTQNL